MSKISKRVLSLMASQTVAQQLSTIGLPPTDKVVMAIVKEQEQRTGSGIIIPTKEVEGVPNRGTIVQVGFISDDYKYLKDHLTVGTIVTYGNYAGKEVEPDRFENDSIKLMVISLAEIMYFEFQ
ncbi:MAG: hypothetical protein RSC49_02085 [Clostridium sp.]